ncbi:MAG: hypothetical protein V3W04_06180 [Gammaproteobacteria bacterium]
MIRLLLLCLLSVPLQVFSATESAAVLWYVEKEKGLEAYKTRYIITQDYMRSDAGNDQDGFILFDRKARIIYNVVPDTETILVLKGDKQPIDRPTTFDIKESLTNASSDTPKIDGKSSREYRLQVDGKPCFSAMIVADFYTQSANAFQEFARVLAAQQVRSLENTPADMISSCFLARAVYAAGNYLSKGLPVLEWNEEGGSKQLLDYAIENVAAELFKTPENYQRYSPGE